MASVATPVAAAPAAPVATPKVAAATHPQITVKGALGTLSGIITAAAASGTAATTFITLLHNTSWSLDLTYALGALTFAGILVHNFSAQFGSNAPS
jgi:hypothetical protein